MNSMAVCWCYSGEELQKATCATIKNETIIRVAHSNCKAVATMVPVWRKVIFWVDTNAVSYVARYTVIGNDKILNSRTMTKLYQSSKKMLGVISPKSKIDAKLIIHRC